MLTELLKKELEALQAKEDGDLTEDEKQKLNDLESLEQEDVVPTTALKKLNKENEKWRRQLREVQEQLKAFDGVDVEEYNELKKKVKDLDNNTDDPKTEDWEKAREKLLENHKADVARLEDVIKQKEDELKSRETELADTVLNNMVTTAAVTEKARNPETVTMLARQYCKVERLEDGKRVVKVVDKDGEERYDARTGKPMTPAQLMKEMKENNEWYMFEDGKPGAGSNSDVPGGAKTVNPWKRETLNLTQQAKILEENPALAARLKSEAG